MIVTPGIMIVGIVLIAIGSFILGYKFCYSRELVDELHQLADIQTRLMTGELTPEKSLELIQSIRRKIESYGKEKR